MKRLRVAIAEDEVLIADLLQQVTEASGHTVVGSARTGEELVAVVESEHPDLVLIDVRLARGSDGLAAAGCVQRRFGVPAIAVAAHLTADDARAAGLFGFLAKPFAVRTVGRMLASAAEWLETGSVARTSGEGLLLPEAAPPQHRS